MSRSKTKVITIINNNLFFLSKPTSLFQKTYIEVGFWKIKTEKMKIKFDFLQKKNLGFGDKTKKN
jgi:hypothetical protein